MPSFDVVSEVNWPEVENARMQTLKEVGQRFDFKGATSTLEVDTKAKEIVLTINRDDKIEAFKQVFVDKLAKRSLPLLSFDFAESEASLGGGSRIRVKVKAGIDKENAKKIVKAVKDAQFKAQVQIQDEQLRVTGKKRDELQEIIAMLKELQNNLQLPLQFGNFRD